jgi:hypothetical protein
MLHRRRIVYLDLLLLIKFLFILFYSHNIHLDVGVVVTTFYLFCVASNIICYTVSIWLHG